MTHYLDVKKQMLSIPTDAEVIEWFRLLQDKLTLTMYRTYEGNYAMYVSNLDIVKVSDTSYLDCLKQIVEEL